MFRVQRKGTSDGEDAIGESQGLALLWVILTLSLSERQEESFGLSSLCTLGAAFLVSFHAAPTPLQTGPFRYLRPPPPPPHQKRWANTAAWWIFRTQDPDTVARGQ